MNIKQRLKNLKINTRIIITTVLAILIPIVIIVAFSPVFINTFNSFFNMSSVTTNSYSTLNQAQWAQTVAAISNDLTGDMPEEQSYAAISNIAVNLESFGTKLYIEKNGEEFYKTQGADNILEEAQSISPFDRSENINHFGSNGLLLVNNTKSSTDEYFILIVNGDYVVNDASQLISFEEFKNLIFGRTGLIILVIMLLYIIAIAVTSFVTSQTIVKPLKKITDGADEIAKGNLDCEIAYDSTNELGIMAKSFNFMRQRLLQSIQTQANSERKRKELVAGIAHDLRTPLTSVKGYAEGLRDGIADTPEKQSLYVGTICSSIDSTEKILDDLLAYSKLELDSFTLNLESVNVNEFFLDGAEEIRSELEKEDFVFNYMTTCSDDAALMLDSDRFTRVIQNVVSNSIKYRRTDIQSEFTLQINEYERTIIIELTDNGIGVDKESIGRIFDTMYRADPARTGVSKGSGLGLAICKQIVELHGGSIWATGDVNKGLSVFISMPKEDNR